MNRLRISDEKMNLIAELEWGMERIYKCLPLADSKSVYTKAHGIKNFRLPGKVESTE